MRKGSFLLPVALLLLLGCAKKVGEQGKTPKSCSVMTLVEEPAELSTTYPATLKGRQDVEIRPNVGGYIVEQCVEEGAIVRKGQVLFRLDSVSYQEAVISAEAQVKTLEANVASNEMTVQNKRLLVQNNVISDIDLKTADYALQALKGQLSMAKAQLMTARKNLSYTNVTSPTDGIIGSIPYRIGSLVGSSITTPLTLVSDCQVMYAYISLTEKQLLRYIGKGGNDMPTIINNLPPVSLTLADGSPYPEVGKIETISGVINTQTGTVTARVRFDNPKWILRSGGSCSVTLSTQRDSSIFIPQRATYEIQNKKFVFVVTDSLTVRNVAVEVADAGDGLRYVVLSGLQPGMKIVSEGIAGLKEGDLIASDPAH